MRHALITLCLLAASGSVHAADRWKLQFFYDKRDSTLTINDLNFSSASRGVAVGFLTEKKKAKPVALTTSDGGETWSLEKLKEPGRSLFFRNESLGWMVTEKGIWKTEDSGHNWKKIPGSPKDTLQVYFSDEKRGWAVGFEKSVYATPDGGAHWTRVAVTDQVQANPDYTFFSWITFADANNGLIAGSNNPPRRGRQVFPDWMEPEQAEKRREWPALNILLDTHDGGKTWKPSTSSMFGRITRIRLAPDGYGLGLIEFFNSFDWPSEVFRIDWKTGKSSRIFRRKDRVVTDIALLENGPAFLAGVEPPGKLFRSPVPGKLKILRSEDLSDWLEMDVDYRAVARRVALSVVDKDHVWAATDTGMILRLTH